MTELKQFWKEERAKFPPQRCKRLMKLSQIFNCSYFHNGWPNQLLSLGGRFLLYKGNIGFKIIFPFNKWNDHFRTVFCVSSHCLFPILELVGWSEVFKMWQISKNSRRLCVSPLCVPTWPWECELGSRYSSASLKVSAVACGPVFIPSSYHPGMECVCLQGKE